MNPFDFPTIILASQSPRRAQLLEQMGVPFEVVLPCHLEQAEALEAVYADEDARLYVARVCLAKVNMMRAQIQAQGQAQQKTAPILCADTTVAFQGKVLGKPTDAEDARAMLRTLSGKTHQVYTAMALAFNDVVQQVMVASDVTFRSLSEAQIQAYIDSGEPFGKAGAYAIQGYAACFIEHLSGSFSAVMGLPIFELAQMLEHIKMKAQ